MSPICVRHEVLRADGGAWSSRNVVQLIVSPASITPEQKATCNALAKQVVDAMDYIGILSGRHVPREGKGTGRIMVNELAPRAHNSGHHTIEQCDVPIRAVAAGRAGSAAR